MGGRNAPCSQSMRVLSQPTVRSLAACPFSLFASLAVVSHCTLAAFTALLTVMLPCSVLHLIYSVSRPFFRALIPSPQIRDRAAYSVMGHGVARVPTTSSVSPLAQHPRVLALTDAQPCVRAPRNTRRPGAQRHARCQCSSRDVHTATRASRDVILKGRRTAQSRSRRLPDGRVRAPSISCRSRIEGNSPCVSRRITSSNSSIAPPRARGASTRPCATRRLNRADESLDASRRRRATDLRGVA